MAWSRREGPHRSTIRICRWRSAAISFAPGLRTEGVRHPVETSTGMAATTAFFDWVGSIVARQLSKPSSGYEPYAAARPELVAMTIRPADVLLIEGRHSKINSAIRYLTQSTWSHAAVYAGLGAKLG